MRVRQVVVSESVAPSGNGHRDGVIDGECVCVCVCVCSGGGGVCVCVGGRGGGATVVGAALRHRGSHPERAAHLLPDCVDQRRLLLGQGRVNLSDSYNVPVAALRHDLNEHLFVAAHHFLLSCVVQIRGILLYLCVVDRPGWCSVSRSEGHQELPHVTQPCQRIREPAKRSRCGVMGCRARHGSEHVQEG
jgi:hypothetical protein